MPVQLSASGAMFYHWQPSTSLTHPHIPNPVATPLQNTTYTVVAGNSLGQFSCAVTKYIHITVIPKAEILSNDSYTFCAGESKMLQVSGSYSYSWSPPIFLHDPSSPSPICHPTASVIYTVTGHNMNICHAQKQITVTVYPLPKVNAGRDTTFNMDDSMWLFGSGQGTLNWNPDPDIICIPCPTTQIYASNSKCYILTAENEFGCKNSDEVCVEITKDYGLYIPNSFTPNDDGLNDEFFVKGHGVSELNIFIYNRWGELVFRGNRFEDRWDGTFKGEKCPEDVYTYLIKFKALDGSFKKKTGHITLLR
jgi:gliding motility-associated-like protein